MGEVNEESFGIIPLRRLDEEWQVFVILHRHGNHWGFPKGKADPGETAQDSAKRELHEETGLKIEKFILQEPISEEYTFYRQKQKVHKKTHYFPAIVSGSLLLQPEEIRDGKWLSFREAYFQLTFEEAKKICLKIEELVE